MFSTNHDATTTPTSTTTTSNTSTDDVEEDVCANYASVQDRIKTACLYVGRDPSTVTLVAVSKTKPYSMISKLYHHPNTQCRTFGENYVQELMSKALQLSKKHNDYTNDNTNHQDSDDNENENSGALAYCPDIHWHFIGTLQSNKAASLVKTVMPLCASLTIETVSSMKLATKLHNAMLELQQQNEENATVQPKKLEILLQVNTSGEESKGGVEPTEVVSLYRDIVSQYSSTLKVTGLMTIGAVGDLSCFDVLVQCRDDIMLQTTLDDSTTTSGTIPQPHVLQLSMGMSGDFEEAIAKGATQVRVGSTIFGNRIYPNPK